MSEAISTSSKVLSIPEALALSMTFMKERAKDDLALYLAWTESRFVTTVGFEAIEEPTNRNMKAMARTLGEVAAESKGYEADECFSAYYTATTLHEISKVARQNSKDRALDYTPEVLKKMGVTLPKYNYWAEGMRARRNFKSAVAELRVYEKTELFPRLSDRDQQRIKQAYAIAKKEVK